MEIEKIKGLEATKVKIYLKSTKVFVEQEMKLKFKVNGKWVIGRFKFHAKAKYDFHAAAQRRNVALRLLR